jgi:phosphoglycolate phosphatase
LERNPEPSTKTSGAIILNPAVRLDVRLAIFDLDGTLIDSKKDLVMSVNAALAHMGMDALDDEVISSYVGNGAPVLIERALGESFTPDTHARALQYFLEYYKDHKLDYTRFYPGVEDSLRRIHAAGIRMAILTNKPVGASIAIIEGLGASALFEQIYGGNSFPDKKPHPVGIETLMAELGAPKEHTLMVGDSRVDIETARNAGVGCVGVRFGFQHDTFDISPPDVIVDRMEDLADLIERA